MEIKPESNNEKILLALIKVKGVITVKKLAEITGVPYKNIHRNIKQLLSNDFIEARIKQTGRKRYKYINFTEKGYNFKVKQVDMKQAKHLALKLDSENKREIPQDLTRSLPVRFGIRFYSWLARELEIPNYSRLSLSQLKLKIGLKLITESNLVITHKQMIKYLSGDK